MTTTQPTNQGNKMSIESIKTVLVKENVGCSVKRIAQLLGVDAPSEVLREIKEMCWEAVECGDLLCTTVMETGEQFFSVK